MGLHRIVVCLAMIASQAIAAPPASDADMSLSALEGYIGGTDAAGRAARIRAAKERLQVRAVEAPSQETSAAVFFGIGRTPADIEQLVNSYGLEIASAQLKAATAVDVQVVTIWIGTRDLVSLPGSLGERLTMAIGRHRAEFLQLSKVAPADEAARYRALASSASIGCYRVDAIGKISSMAEASADPTVVAVFLQESPDLIAGYRLAQKWHQSKRTLSPEVLRGPPPKEGAPLSGYTEVVPPSTPPPRQ